MWDPFQTALSWIVNGGDPNYVLTGMILQVVPVPGKAGEIIPGLGHRYLVNRPMVIVSPLRIGLDGTPGPYMA